MSLFCPGYWLTPIFCRAKTTPQFPFSSERARNWRVRYAILRKKERSFSLFFSRIGFECVGFELAKPDRRAKKKSALICSKVRVSPLTL